MESISDPNPPESAQEHIQMCEKHYLRTDITCDDCDKFICKRCAKTDHMDHDWNTISTAASIRRRDLKMSLKKMRENELREIDKKIEMTAKQIEDNQKRCDIEISKLQKHYKGIISRLDEIKKNRESLLRDNLKRKNAEVREKTLDLENKKKQAIKLVKFVEEKHSTMSDYSLLDNLRDFPKLMPDEDSDIGRAKGDYSIRYGSGVISEELLESMMGQTFDLDDICYTETDSFQYGDKPIDVIEAVNEDRCFARKCNVGYIELVTKMNKIENHIHTRVNDA